MEPITGDQRDYKERTLSQLLANKAQLEARLEQEQNAKAIRSLESQVDDIDAHISRLRDELAGNIIVDEPVADELFMRAVKALAKEKFFLARRYIGKLETIEPFYPGLDRMKEEAEAGKVSRRTRSIAMGTATSYPGTDALPGYANPDSDATADVAVDPELLYTDRTRTRFRFSQLLEFHYLASCFVVLVLMCMMFGVGGVSFLQWLIEG